MASLADEYTYSQTTTFTNRTRVAVVSALLAIQNELPSTAFHKDRIALAVTVMNNLDVWVTKFAIAASNDATVAGKIASGGATGTDTDADLATAISAAWNGFALR